MKKLTECKICVGLVSKTAKVCPHCGETKPGAGNNIASSLMKGGLSLMLLTFLLSFIFVIVLILWTVVTGL